jgi:hypothetical protein
MGELKKKVSEILNIKVKILSRKEVASNIFLIKLLAQKEVGDNLDILGFIGNGFNINQCFRFYKSIFQAYCHLSPSTNNG